MFRFQANVLLQQAKEILEGLDAAPMKDSVSTAFDKSVDYTKQGRYQEAIKWAEVIVDWCWERLHSGHWENVSIEYRKIYSLAIALKANGLNNEGEFQEALCAVDKGILLGAPVMDDWLHKVAEDLVGKIGASVVDVEPSKTFDKSIDPVKRRTSKENSSEAKRMRVEGEDIKDTATIVCTDSSLNYCPIERVECPSLQNFLNDYMKLVKPVILTGCMEHWPALNERKWSLDYLKKTVGARTVPVELGSRYTDDGWSQKLMTVKEFISEYVERQSTVKGYLAQHTLFQQVPQLQEDICVPDYCCLKNEDVNLVGGASPMKEEGSEEEDIKINAWFGPSETVSPLHFDPQHNLLAQVMGSKFIVLFSSLDTPFLYPREGDILTNTSQVNVESPDYGQHPLFKQAKGIECVLKEGEMLYIPTRWWHFVKSLTISFSVSFWWN